jgi:HD-GYP domain-containing protein (c-di-GMP phosphodiesterase class II)
MKTKNIRKEISLLLKSKARPIVKKWSESIFKVPGHLRDKDVISKKTHKAGMQSLFKEFINDISLPKSKRCESILTRLIFKDYLSASNAADVIQGLMLLRSMLINIVSDSYKYDIKKLKIANNIIIEAISKNIVCVSDIYKQRDFARLETIMMYGKRMIKVHNIKKLCDLILEAATIESGSDRASLMLLEKDGYLYIKSSIGIPKKIADNTKVRIGCGISGTVAKTGEPVIISKGYKVPENIKRSMRGLGLKSALSIPLISDSTLQGVLNLGKYKSRHLFDKDDAELLMILAYEAGTAISNCRLFQETHDLYEGSIFSLAAAIDAKDHYTHGHSEKVSEIAVEIGRILRLPADTLSRIKLASMLHDIGKIGVPDNILLKPGRLTNEEFDIIKKHPLYAVNILKHLPRLKDIIPIVYHEHEHYDGSGYPKGQKADAIPIESRIIAVADAYEAMTSDRSYRKAMPKKKAIKEIKQNSGTQFDPLAVKAFLKVAKRLK